jgi:predicted phage terminase large subunit-like protein
MLANKRNIKLNVNAIQAILANNFEADKCKASLSYFVQKAFNVIDQAEYEHNWHIDLICERLQQLSNGQLKRLIINIPPGHMKSLLVNVMWQAWEWLSNPQKSFINTSHTSSLSIRDSVKMRALLSSDWYKSINPSFKFQQDQNAKSYYVNSSNGYRYSIGFGGKATGYRSDYIVIDDPISASGALSQNERNKCIEFFDYELSNRLNNMETGAIVLIMQRLHINDLTGHLLNRGGWTHLCLPAVFDESLHDKIDGDDRLDGELLFPTRFSHEVLEQEKITKGLWGFAGQYQQSPFPADGGLFKKEYFKNVLPLPCNLHDFNQVVQVWDMAFKGGANSDYVACVVGAYHNGKFWLIDFIKEKLSFNASLEMVRQIANKYPQSKHNIHIEDKANGTAIIDTIRTQLSGYSVKEIKAIDSKIARANSVEPILVSGNLYINQEIGANKINLLTNDMIQFRENGGNDDLVDAVVHWLRLMKNSGSSAVWSY